jgi:hypothetical protein
MVATFLLLLLLPYRKIRGAGIRRHPQRCPTLREGSARAGARAGLRPPYRGRDTARREGAHEPDRVAKEVDRQHGEGQAGDGGVRHRCVLGVRSLNGGGAILYFGGKNLQVIGKLGGGGGSWTAAGKWERFLMRTRQSKRNIVLWKDDGRKGFGRGRTNAGDAVVYSCVYGRGDESTNSALNSSVKQLNCHYIICGWTTSKVFLTNSLLALPTSVGSHDKCPTARNEKGSPGLPICS